jgi:UDP-N-acetylmuramoyl-tripeptide--D-alanyl-D-alanine ligase
MNVTPHAKPVLWTAAETTAATAGRTHGEWRATGVSIDSRSIEKGDLFVAVKGPKFDGHAFVAEALRGGAAAAMVSHRPPGVSEEASLLIVDDTLEALRRLGGAARNRTRARIIAVTGSVGKTGTKEALRTVLGRQYAVFATAGNLNNHWGLPLSLARLPLDAEIGIFEMGMNHPGEISPLSRLARPHVAMITTVEPVHKAFFDSVEAIADAKAEIFAGIEANGVAVLNRDNRFFSRLAAATEAAGVSRIISFGADAGADVRLTEATIEADGSRLKVMVDGEALRLRVGAPGRHWVINSLGVLAVVRAAGGDVKNAAASLAVVELPKGRGRRHRLTIEGGDFELIDESYNASPVSMCAAFEVLGVAQPGVGGRRIAVLGDMLELGADAGDLHADLAAPLRRNGIDVVFTAGTHMARLWEVLPAAMRGGHAVDTEALLPLVLVAVRPGDVVTVKGSAGSRTGLIVQALLGLGANGGDAPRRRTVNGE